MVATDKKSGRTMQTFRLASTKAGRVVDEFMSRGRRSAHTRRSYRGDLTSIACFMLGPPEPIDDAEPDEAAEAMTKHIEKAVGRILRMKPGTAQSAVGQFAMALRINGKSSATVKHRQAAWSGLIRSAARIGAIDWTIEIDMERVITYADTEARRVRA